MASDVPENPVQRSHCKPFPQNAHIIQLYRSSLKYKDEGQFRILHKWACDLAGIDPKEVHMNSLNSKIKSVYTKFSALRKRKYNLASAYEKESFQFPVSRKRKIDTEEPLGSKSIKPAGDVKDLRKWKDAANRRFKRRDQKIKNLLLKNRLMKPKKISKQTQSDIVKKQDKEIQCNLNSKEIKELKDKLYDYEIQNDIDITEEDTVDEASFNVRLNNRGRPYSAKVRQICYDFISKGVAVENIPPLIVSVVNNLTNSEISLHDLPSPACIQQMNLELTHLCRKQLSEALSDEKYTTVLRDGTTKKGRHYYGVKIKGENEIYTVGLREVAQATADKLVSVTKTMIDDIGEVSADDKLTDKIISSISNTMTDRCATELKVNKLLVEMKKKSVNNIRAEPESSSPNDTEYVEQINEFKCAVHPLLQFASEAENVLKKIENQNGIGLSFGDLKGESACKTFVRNVSKLFYKDGTGDPLVIQQYIRQRVTRIPILNFKGNRFNILFYNAAGIYILQKHIQSYLEDTKQSLNFVQDMVLSGLKMPFMMALCRALGIISHSITQPYWKEASRTTVSALEMGHVYNNLIDRLQHWTNNAKPLALGQETLYNTSDMDHLNGDNSVLYSECSNQTFVELVLSEMCAVLCNKARKLFSDFMPGTKFYCPSELIMTQAKSCPQNNISLERLMAQADKSVVTFHNANTTTRETKIMFKENKTGEWLKEKSDEEKADIIKKAMETKPKLKQEEKLRKQDLKNELIELIKRKEEDKNRKGKK